MKDKKRLAIIIVNYNGFSDTKECIESINNKDESILIIVVDNGSKNDESRELKSLFPDIHTIRSEINGGFSYGNNLGIKYALDNNYDYCMLLNNDTLIDSGMIHLLLTKADDKTITVPTMFYASMPDTIWYGGGFINRSTGNSQHKRMNTKENVDLLKDEESTFATGCCILFNSNLVKRIGMFNEEMFMYCEDTEFCIRALKDENRILYVPQAKLWHKVSKSTGGSASQFSTYYMTRNRFYCIKKHRDFYNWTAMPFTFVSRIIRMILYYLKRDLNYEAIKMGIIDYYKGITGRNRF